MGYISIKGMLGIEFPGNKLTFNNTTYQGDPALYAKARFIEGRIPPFSNRPQLNLNMLGCSVTTTLSGYRKVLPLDPDDPHSTLRAGYFPLGEVRYIEGQEPKFVRKYEPRTQKIDYPWDTGFEIGGVQFNLDRSDGLYLIHPVMLPEDIWWGRPEDEFPFNGNVGRRLNELKLRLYSSAGMVLCGPAGYSYSEIKPVLSSRTVSVVQYHLSGK